MIYTYKYKSPLGRILLAADEVGITGLWFEGQKYFGNTLPDKHIPQETEILTEAKKWLDVYFSGEEPKFTPPLHPDGSTFRQAVWKILLQIPYGQTITYGEIARKMAELKNVSRMSAQAVGGAVGHNEISIIIPCHRVIAVSYTHLLKVFKSNSDNEKTLMVIGDSFRLRLEKYMPCLLYTSRCV